LLLYFYQNPILEEKKSKLNSKMRKQRVQPANFGSELSFATNPDIFSSSSFELTTADLRPVQARPFSPPKLYKASIKPESSLLPTEFKAAKEKNPIKNFIISLISNFGILFLLIGYAFLGALLFQIMEQHKTQAKQGEWINLKDTYTALIYNYLNYNVTFNPILKRAMFGDNTEIRDGPAVYNRVIKDWLVELRNRIVKIKFDGSTDDAYCESIDRWELWNSFLFTITVVTTIGKINC